MSKRRSLRDIFKMSNPKASVAPHNGQTIGVAEPSVTRLSHSIDYNSLKSRFSRNSTLIDPNSFSVIADYSWLTRYQTFGVFKPPFAPMEKSKGISNAHNVSLESYVDAVIRSQEMEPLVKALAGDSTSDSPARSISTSLGSPSPSSTDTVNLQVLNPIDEFASGPVALHVSNPAKRFISSTHASFHYEVMVHGHVSIAVMGERYEMWKSERMSQHDLASTDNKGQWSDDFYRSAKQSKTSLTSNGSSSWTSSAASVGSNDIIIISDHSFFFPTLFQVGAQSTHGALFPFETVDVPIVALKNVSPLGLRSVSSQVAPIPVPYQPNDNISSTRALGDPNAAVSLSSSFTAQIGIKKCGFYGTHPVTLLRVSLYNPPNIIDGVRCSSSANGSGKEGPVEAPVGHRIATPALTRAVNLLTNSYVVGDPEGSANRNSPLQHLRGDVDFPRVFVHMYRSSYRIYDRDESWDHGHWIGSFHEAWKNLRVAKRKLDEYNRDSRHSESHSSCTSDGGKDVSSSELHALIEDYAQQVSAAAQCGPQPWLPNPNVIEFACENCFYPIISDDQVNFKKNQIAITDGLWSPVSN
eukprot:Tbor_TRINITY_DN3761_c0_g1::TRINITY_DN3761_c0_g1_i1::g.2336::m.2336